MWLAVVTPNGSTDDQKGGLKVPGDCPSVVCEVLEDFKDVFPPKLPMELPPKRAVDHKIEITPGANPPAPRLHKMVFAE